MILCMERHGSWSKGTRQYWDASERVQAAHQRQVATKEIPTPLSLFTRRVLQTLAIALWRSNASHILQFKFYRRVVVVLGGSWAVELWRDSWLRLALVVAFKKDRSGTLSLCTLSRHT